MILINLLPHREEARKRRRDVFYVALGTSAVVGGLIAGGIYLWFTAQISAQQERNALLNQEITKLEAQIKDIATLQAEIAALRARQQSVEDLQADRNMPVHLMNELVRQLPDGVYITSMKQNNDVVQITGMAQSNERVSELLRNLGSNSPWLTRPELVEIVASNITVPGSKDQRRVSSFNLRVKLLRAAEVRNPASGASGAVGAASGAVATASGTATVAVVGASAAKP